MPIDTGVNTAQNTGLKVNIDNSRGVTATQSSFANTMSEGLNKTAGAILTGVSYATPFVPGGAVLSAAVSGVGNLRSQVTGQSASGINGSGVAGIAGGNVSSGAMGGTTGYATGNSAVDGLAAGGDTSAVLLQQTQRMQEMNQSFNLQYLQLQENMQADNRQFTTLSNVMKTKQDTAKNAINNLR